MKRILATLLTIAALFGCDDGANAGDGGNQIRNPIHLTGAVVYDLPAPGLIIQLIHIYDGVRTPMSARKSDIGVGDTTNERGHWGFVPTTRHAGEFEIVAGSL